MNKGLLATLFDLSFNQFVTTKILKIIYVLGIVASAVATIFMLTSAVLTNEAIVIVVAMLLAPLIFLISVIFVRLYVELIIVLFRIAENTSALVRGQSGHGQRY
ncbi:MAG TPA: DUF4282 domain-containing protein [Luteolibacter sp.]|nr:DUF4282 domain-containing protein [Luteolibacter sp.]